MGIKDLLRFMKPYIKPIHIKKYTGKRVGIDAYSWLHKGAYSCSMELCLNSNSERKLRYLDYFMHRINLLRHHNVTPVVVFDGGDIPCKAKTEQERDRRRKANRDMAMEKLKEGNSKAASELFQRAITITPVMAHQLIQILRAENIEFVVAPYEADAQLAYLSCLQVEKGGIVAVITEDSDLVVYGCQATVFKMDRHGNGEELVLDNVFGSETCIPSFRNFDRELFIGMCVLAGCDFLPSVPGIGIAKAHSMVSKYRNLDRVLSILKFEKGSQVPEDYSKSFGEAVAVFQHARVYDADIKKLKHIKPLSEKLLQSLDGELAFLGPYPLLIVTPFFSSKLQWLVQMYMSMISCFIQDLIFILTRGNQYCLCMIAFFCLTIMNYVREIPPSVAAAIAEGHLDPVSMEAFNCFSTSGYHQTLVVSQPSTRLQKPEISIVSNEETGFTVFASHKTIEKETTDTLKQGMVSIETKFFKEGAALQKLLLPSKIHETIEVPDNIPMKIPDNNPFKKRKFDEMQLDQMKSHTEEVSVLSEDEKLDVLCVTPDLNLPKVRKLHGSYMDQRQSVTEEVSVITEFKNSNLCITTESQESVNSKPKGISRGKESRKTEKKKRSNCNSSVNKSNGILNFFSRV